MIDSFWFYVLIFCVIVLFSIFSYLYGVTKGMNDLMYALIESGLVKEEDLEDMENNG
jgi:hypothetical protein